MRQLLFFTFFFSVLYLSAQHTEDRRRKAMVLLKEYELNKAQIILEKAENTLGVAILHGEIDYLKSGTLPSPGKYRLEKAKDGLDSVLYYTALGKYFSRKMKPDDSLSFKNNLIAFNLGNSIGDTLSINQSLREINRFFLKNFKDQVLYKKYVDLLHNYRQDHIDNFWSSYYGLVYEMTYSSFEEEAFLKLEQGFLNLRAHAPNQPYFYGIADHMTGIFYSYPKDISSSRKYFKSAIETYNNTHYYSYSRRVRTEIALAMINARDKQYNLAIEQLTAALDNQFVQKDFKVKKLIYNSLSGLYKDMNEDAISRTYLELRVAAEDSIEQYAFAQGIREIDTKYEVEQKDQKIGILKKEKMSLENKLISLIPIILIIVAIAIFLFFVYKRYKKKSVVLEEEKSETLQKLDELKEVVIKNHIVLKDKTKVYIADLLYVKADDHYLHIFTSEGKNHFVRGKLSQIKQELPPNFIQCHRSYIVNTNFIKRINKESLTLISKDTIPLSRSFKKNF